ncbi:hypothetical protein DMUE_5336, partial [Dictyocoela muelleri]
MYIPLKHSIESEKSSTLSPHDWSVYERLKLNIPRTNNGAVGWHRGLNDSIGITHPNIALFINKILNKENEENYKLIQLKTGRFKWKTENSSTEYKIRHIMSSFDLLTDEEYLNLLLSVI